MSYSATQSHAVVEGPTDGTISATGHVLLAGGDAHSCARRQSQLSAAGFRVSIARTGFEAIVKACCHIPDLILIDNSINDIEPAETGRLITTCPVTAHIPIVRVAAGRQVPPRVFAWLRRLVG
jgi:CheY-like chemotaxis protein